MSGQKFAAQFVDDSIRTNEQSHPNLFSITIDTVDTKADHPFRMIHKQRPERTNETWSQQIDIHQLDLLHILPGIVIDKIPVSLTVFILLPHLLENGSDRVVERLPNRIWRQILPWYHVITYSFPRPNLSR
ncbi:MAG: hypothetical protein JWQ94_1909 [Tardiphaga sp.]|nr:hypothetical protein [Tardiphaga sp.]